MNQPDDSNSIQRARKKVKVGSARVVSSLLATVTLVGAGSLGVSWKLVDDIAQSVTPIASSKELKSLSAPIINARRNPQTLSQDVRFRSLRSQLLHWEKDCQMIHVSLLTSRASASSALTPMCLSFPQAI